jgi:hypothetical protein
MLLLHKAAQAGPLPFAGLILTVIRLPLIVEQYNFLW